MGKVTPAAVVTAAAKAPKRHTPLKISFFRADNPDYGCFSNFYKGKNPLRYNGKRYSTSEHLFQSLKFMYDGSPAVNLLLAEAIRTQTTPYKAAWLARGGARGGARYTWQKELAVKYKGYEGKGAKIDPEWDTKRVDVMREVVKLKAKQDAEFAQKLKATGAAELEENSPFDDFWGVGRNGRGQNWLGKILMEVRDTL